MNVIIIDFVATVNCIANVIVKFTMYTLHTYAIIIKWQSQTALFDIVSSHDGYGKS